MPDILLIKANVILSPADYRRIRENILAQKESGVILLPRWCEAQIVPEGIEIRVEESDKKYSNL